MESGWASLTCSVVSPDASAPVRVTSTLNSAATVSACYCSHSRSSPLPRSGGRCQVTSTPSPTRSSSAALEGSAGQYRSCWSGCRGGCLRHPAGHAPTGRLVIGWACCIGGVLGIAHALAGTPQPVEGAAAMRGGGGFVGFMVSAPLVSGLTTWVAVPVMVLMVGFGVLVLTATPVHQVPERLAELRDRLLLRSQVPDDDVIDLVAEDSHELAAPMPRRKRNWFGMRRDDDAIVPTGPEAFETPVIAEAMADPVTDEQLDELEAIHAAEVDAALDPGAPR